MKTYTALSDNTSEMKPVRSSILWKSRRFMLINVHRHKHKITFVGRKLVTVTSFYAFKAV